MKTVDAALEDKSLITDKVPASKSELSSNDQVVSMEAGETNNAVTQFVGDIIDLNIVSIHGNTPFHSVDWIKVASPAPPLPYQQTTASVPRVKLKALDKAKIMREGEVKIIPFTNSKEIGTDAIMFYPSLSYPPPWAMISQSLLQVKHGVCDQNQRF